MLRLVVMILAVGACARGGALLDPDAATGDAPAAEVDAPISGAVGALLLTEVVLAPSTGEFIEIVNPGTQPVDLSTFYLADGGSYFQLPAVVPTLDSGDFIVKFPPGATIAPHAVITIALDTPANFMSVYGAAPTYSVAGASMTSVAHNGIPSMTNAGEVVILFQWGGQTDLVHDVDLMLAGVPTPGNGLVDKSGVSIDGPDAGSATSMYAIDARTLAVQPTAPAAGRSTKRIALEAGHESQGGGNGIAGDDETSEDIAATWDSAFTIPTPGTIPTGMLP